MTDDLVCGLRTLAKSYENEGLASTAGKVRKAADRIEALESKLAICRLGGAIMVCAKYQHAKHLFKVASDEEERADKAAQHMEALESQLAMSNAAMEILGLKLLMCRLGGAIALSAARLKMDEMYAAGLERAESQLAESQAEIERLQRENYNLKMQAQGIGGGGKCTGR